MQKSFFHSLLWRLLFPVVVIGTAFSLLLGYFLLPPLVNSLERSADKTISHSGTLGLNICEERLHDMLDLRLAENEEMNKASKREALEEIEELSNIFPRIKMVVFDDTGEVQGSSFSLPSYQSEELLKNIDEMQPIRNIYTSRLFNRAVYLHHEYFPFWRWHIISFMDEETYFQPIIRVKRIVNFGNFGILLVVIASVVLLFLLRINSPLQEIIKTTEEVRRGNFDKVNLKGQGEIEQVAVAFDHMVEKLERDKKALDSILDELRESEEKYRILSENTLTLVLVISQQGLQYANRAATIFFSLLPSDVPGKDFFTLFAEHEQERLRGHVEALEKANSGVEHFELSYTPQNDEQRWLEVVASVIPYMGSQAILFHALDVSRRKRMEIEQEAMRQKIARGEQMEALGTLAGGVAHDLNNILGGVVSYPELLLQGMDKDNKLYSPLKTIHQSGVKAAAIVQDLLTLTRRGVVVTEVVNLGNIIREYLTSPEFDYLCKEFPNIYVALQIDDKLMNIKGSYHHLSKSIMNLVTNSAEALPTGGDILITAQNLYVDSPFGSYDEINEGEYVAVSISDNGEGISAEDLDKIFEPFYTKKVMGRSGTGLGMSVVWGTVKDHQGYIDIDSKKGEGSTFTLYFPASREDLSESVAALTTQAPQGKGEKLLVVDDIEEQRLIAATMLEHLGYEVDVAESGELALLTMEDKQYALILLDMIMEPGMDGLDTFKEILRIYPQQKAVIASGFSETERVRSALAMGAGAYIKKPYGLEALAKTINEVLSRKNDAT